MVVNIRKKNTRQRGSKTHGWGSMKKHRGAGSRGGRGRAGSGKRGDSKKPSLLWKKGIKAKGKVGFISKKVKKNLKVITLDYFQKHIDIFKKENDVIDLSGYKLLGNGACTLKFKVTVGAISKKAKEKLEANGSEIINSKE